MKSFFVVVFCITLANIKNKYSNMSKFSKRHRRVFRDNIQGITKPAIRRLARRGGVKRLSGLIYDETRGVLKEFLEKIVRDAVQYTEHANRKTVSAMDVIYALKRHGRTMYGFGGHDASFHAVSKKKRQSRVQSADSDEEAKSNNEEANSKRSSDPSPRRGKNGRFCARPNCK